MLVNKSNKSLITLGIIILLSCNQKEVQNLPLEKNKSQSPLVNCYITKPVIGNTTEKSIGDVEFEQSNYKDFITAFKFSTKYQIDKDAGFILSFERQRKININSKCVSNLTVADTDFLMDLFYDTGQVTRNFSKSIIKFVGSYHKKIDSFGSCVVYEYQLNDVSETEPHFMHLLIKEQRDEDKRIGKDVTGIVLFSDGIKWEQVNSNDLPSFIHRIRRAKEVAFPLTYDGNRFVPVGHFKLGDW